jgi:putative ABC transport system permease protein
MLVRPLEGVLGVPGRLGLDYVERTLERSTVSVVALMVAVSMSVSVGGSLASFQRSLFDYLDQPSPAELTVTAVSGMREMLNKAFSYSHTVEWVTLLVALMGIASTMIAAVLDRRREIGALRAIGATRRQMATTMVVEAGFLALCAVVGGVGLGMLQGTLFIKTLLLNDTGWHVTFVFPWLSTARIALLSLLTSMLAGGIAAYLASRANVAGSVAHE